MQIKLKYFGEIAELIGSTEEVIKVDEGYYSNHLCNLLEKKHSGINSINYRIAINQAISNDTVVLNEADEVAFLPSFAGG